MKKSLLHVALVAFAALLFVFGIAACADVANHAPDLVAMQFDMPTAWQMVAVGMTTLAADKARPYELGTIQQYPVVAADIIYEGAAVGENGSGYARPLVALDPFLGFAESKVDNSAGAAGALDVRVRMKGQVQLAVAGATAITANDRPLVYASDDDTFTLTSTSNTCIGRVSRWISSGVAIVEFDALVAPAL